MVIASTSTLAANLTVLGSIANLIVLEEARKQKVEISFAEYLRIGLPVTIITLAVDIVRLSTFSPTWHVTPLRCRGSALLRSV